MSAETRYPFAEVDEALVNPTPWLVSSLQEFSLPIVRSTKETVDSVQVSVKVISESACTEYEIGEWTPAELYGYSEAPFVDLANFFGILQDECENLCASVDDALNFEILTVNLWQQVKILNKFLGISAKHDELIASLFSIIDIDNGVLSIEKVSVLSGVFGDLKDVISLSDEALDAIYDRLEDAGFCLEDVFDA